MKIAVLSNGTTVIVVGLDKNGDPIDKDGTLFGPESGRDITEFDAITFNPSRGEVIIVDPESNPGLYCYKMV